MFAAASVPTNAVLGIYLDDGPGGSPGTPLAVDTILVNSPTLQWYTADFSAQNIIINSGSFYVGYEQL
ncbi:MAG: hypothetical protein IH968_15550, partial [Gemmatimonadetes bacterium]|nr:hypothetical protein [Gemmatimonadota bacterium]